MKQKLWRNKWFILASAVALFFVVTSAKVAYATPTATDVQLEKILKAATDGFAAYLNFLLDVLKEIWK